MDLSTTARRIVAVTALVVVTSFVAPVESAHADSLETSATIAVTELGKGPCAATATGVGYDNSCTGAPGGVPELWCADFAKWVWERAGQNVYGLTAAAGSFGQYGTPDDAPHVGDAVLFNYDPTRHWAAHVAIVTEVHADGTITSVGGDEGGDRSGDDALYARTAKVERDTYNSARGTPLPGSGGGSDALEVSLYVSPPLPGLPDVGAPPGGTVRTGGIPLHIRACAGFTCGVIGAIPDGSQVPVYCQQRGDTVNGNWGPTDLWDLVQTGGFVSDGFVYTGSNNAVAPPCSPTVATPGGGTVQTGGIPLNIRACAGRGCSIVGTVADGTQVSIICQIHGDTVNGNWGATDLWDAIRPGGFISDGFVFTGTNSQIAPSC
jgi:uncharacterized protein YraI